MKNLPFLHFFSVNIQNYMRHFIDYQKFIYFFVKKSKKNLVT